MATIAARLGVEHPAETARLFSSWESIVGPGVAAKCRPVLLRAGELKLEAVSSGWASELRYLGPELARRINAALGKEVVRSVVAFVAGQRR